MRIGVLGTGVVGLSIAGKLSELGHAVMLGTRDPAATRARTQPGRYGTPSTAGWLEQHPRVELGTFAQAAAHGEMVVNATSGEASMPVLEAAGEKNLAGKVLIDISNPLDFSEGFPPSLTVCNKDSLGEQIQRRFPGARVVKTLNTVNATVMTAPGQLAGGEHTLFVSGNDAGAKKAVTELLATFGWKDVLDLGDITTARGVEMYLPLWVRLMSAAGKPMFNIKVVR